MSLLKIVTKTHFLFFLILIFFSFFSSPAFAQNSGAGISIIPAVIEKPADPGSVFVETVKITNESDTDTEYYVYTRNIKGVENGGVPIFAESNTEVTGFELTEWVSFESERVNLRAGETVEFPITITVPSDATPGSHFAGFFVSVEPPKLREIGAGVGYEVVSILSIRISGDVVDEVRIRSFSTSKLFYGSKDVDFIARVENQGNIMVRPRGPLVIYNSFSEEPEDNLEINGTQAGVFPGTTRDFNFSWSGEGLGFGKYTAELALVYEGDGGNRTIDASLVFWVFPMKILLGFLGGFITVFLIGYLFTRYYIKQAVMRAAGGRRIVTQRYRRQSSISRFAFIFTSVLAVFVIFLIVLLIFMA